MAVILAIVGERLAGKDTVGKYLEEKYGAFQIKYSHILDEILDILDQPKSRRNEIDLGMAMRSVFHEGVLNPAVRKKVLSSDKALRVINGIRFLDEFETARALAARFLYVTAPQELLYQRFLARQEKADDSSLSAQEFAALENEPTEAKIPQLGARCDFKIDNIGTLAELYDSVDKIMKQLK